MRSSDELLLVNASEVIEADVTFACHGFNRRSAIQTRDVARPRHHNISSRGTSVIPVTRNAVQVQDLSEVHGIWDRRGLATDMSHT